MLHARNRGVRCLTTCVRPSRRGSIGPTPPPCDPRRASARHHDTPVWSSGVRFVGTGKSCKSYAGGLIDHAGTRNIVRGVDEREGTVTWKAKAQTLAEVPVRAH